MSCLAINQEWVTLPKLLENIGITVSQGELLEALESLQQRSLIESHSGIFTQQPVIMEYMSELGNVN